MTGWLALMTSDLRRESRRRWFLAVLGAGLAASVFVVIAAATVPGDGVDDLRADGAATLLLAGVVLALGLGSTAFWRDIQSGSLGLVAAAGAPRAAIATSRVVSRALLLAIGLAVWTITVAAGAAIIGQGFDGDFVVHGLAQFETLALTLVATAAVSTVLGPWVAAIVGLMVHISAQATVNLAAAADLGRLGSANRLAHIAENMLPHSILSPMIAEMQNRDAGGPAAPQFKVDELPIPIHHSTWGSVVWTALWCGFIAWLCFVGVRRRNLN